MHVSECKALLGGLKVRYMVLIQVHKTDRNHVCLGCLALLIWGPILGADSGGRFLGPIALGTAWCSRLSGNVCSIGVLLEMCAS